MKLKNKVVLITGTNRGIGKSLVKAVLDKGAKKVYATSRSLSKNIDFKDKRIVLLELDITDIKKIEDVARYATDTQVLINNAGILSQGNILEGDLEKIHLDMDVNYFSTINMMRAFAPVIEKNTSPAIINIVSIAAYTNFPFIAGYSASKAALYSATQAARIELKNKGISVYAIHPGAIDTDMNKGYEGEMTSPDEVAISILNEVETDKPDIIPDKVGRGMYEIWKKNPPDLEEIASKMYNGE